MSERKLAMYPERPSEMAESYIRAIEVFHSPPEFILNPEEKADVQAFEQALCKGEFPKGFEFLGTRTELPPKNIAEIVAQKVGLNTFCVDWYLKTPDGNQTLQRLGYEGNLTDKIQIKSFLARTIPRVKSEGMNTQRGESRNWAESELITILKNDLEHGESETEDPEFLTLVESPQAVIDKIANARKLKNYYKNIESVLQHEQKNRVTDAKLVFLTMHRERVNDQIANLYRQAIPLLNQYRLAPEILTSEQIDALTDSFPVLKSADTTDMEKMARLFSMIDKFITGIDAENGFGQISAEIERLEIALRDEPKNSETHQHSLDAERLADHHVDSEEMKKFVQKALAEYDLLSSEEKYSVKDKGRPPDKLWRAVISKVQKSFSVNSAKGVVWIPISFDRTLNQKKPTGVLPLLDHELTHVLQHENAAKLRIGLMQVDRGARGSLWFETGATRNETEAYAKYFGIERGTNFNYLKAMQKQLAGGSISECAKMFYESLLSSGDVTDKEKAIETAVNRTLRLFRNGTEWSQGTGYLTNTEPLEYAEQQILDRNMPEDLRWLYFVGRANFHTLAELHRIGWLNREEIFIPERMPAEIALEELVANEA